MCEDWGWQGCGPQRRAGAAKGMEDEVSQPDRAERWRNGLAKLVPTLKPRNGLNDSWRVAGCGHSIPASTPSLLGNRRSSLLFYLFPAFPSPSLSLFRALSKKERSRQAVRKEGPSFLSELPSSDPSRKLTPDCASSPESGFLKYRVLLCCLPADYAEWR